MTSVSRETEALGQSEPFLHFQEKLSRVAEVDRPVLLIGERGTGKELAAGRVHFLSRRWEKPFITLNCAALSPTLIEAELFGYERGAFTGAESQRTGRFEAADGGTLFLDEIGNIPKEAQEKILRVVEYGFFERVGSSTPIEVDVRIVGATNADLPVMARRGKFRQDLLDRLSFEVLFLPPLRERDEDIMLLAHHFAGRMSYELGRDFPPEFSDEAIAEMESYAWPGNIRELKNVVERAVYSTHNDTIETIVFDPFISPYAHFIENVADEIKKDGESDRMDIVVEKSLKQAIIDYEQEILRRAFVKNRYNRKKTAEQLGLSYDQLRGLIRKHGAVLLGLS
ncbi:phage shock protein operon transcriptional activator [Desulfopila sp. IMCC35008]|uniref:phage shock protein operon transcriptional activator n=1 Tax=Desulfopila sp. IMCC35008 TaxID=2653858 RepID=UPI0013D60CBD|nr:phage shock protein operon transcriptional activator [Desulfopila sp. IMCC35008]